MATALMRRRLSSRRSPRRSAGWPGATASAGPRLARPVAFPTLRRRPSPSSSACPSELPAEAPELALPAPGVPVTPLLGAVVRYHHQVLDADPDDLLTPGAPVDLRTGHLSNGEPLPLSPGRSHTNGRAWRLRGSPFPGGTM